VFIIIIIKNVSISVMQRGCGNTLQSRVIMRLGCSY